MIARKNKMFVSVKNLCLSSFFSIIFLVLPLLKYKKTINKTTDNGKNQCSLLYKYILLKSGMLAITLNQTNNFIKAMIFRPIIIKVHNTDVKIVSSIFNRVNRL